MVKANLKIERKIHGTQFMQRRKEITEGQRGHSYKLRTEVDWVQENSSDKH